MIIKNHTRNVPNISSKERGMREREREREREQEAKNLSRYSTLFDIFV